MGSISWALYVLVVAFAFILPTSIASPADISPRHNVPSYALERANYVWSCRPVPWLSEDMAVHYEILDDQDDLVIMIQANRGAIICFISESKMNDMQIPGAYHTKFGEIRRSFLNEYLQGKIDQLAEGDCPTLEVFAAQIVAPKKRPGEKLLVDRPQFVRQLAAALRKKLLSMSKNRLLDIPVYPYTSASVCAMQQVFTPKEHKLRAGVMLTVRKSGDREKNAGQVGYVLMSKESPRSSPNDPKAHQQATFAHGKPTYTVKGLYLVESLPTDWERLFDPEKRTQLATNAVSLEASSARGGGCEHVAWSPDGSLIFMVNGERWPTWSIQTSVGAILCYVSVDPWKEILSKWQYRQTNKDFKNALAAYLLDPIRAVMKEQDAMAETNRVFRIRFSDDKQRSKEMPKFLADVQAEFRECFAMKGDQQRAPADSKFPFEESTYKTKPSGEGQNSESAYAWMAMWQEALDVKRMETSVWTWQMGPSRFKNLPTWRSDLSQGTITECGDRKNVQFGGYDYAPLSFSL